MHTTFVFIDYYKYYYGEAQGDRGDGTRQGQEKLGTNRGTIAAFRDL